MRLPFLFSLAVALLVGGVAWYRLTADECPAPLAYRIEAIDSHFNLSLKQAKAHLANAESVWEASAGRELFYYDESADVVVNFVFDERQALADSESNDRQYLDEMKAEHEAVFAAVEKLQQEYQALKVAYEQKAADYERRLNAYNQKVSTYNDRGGAPGNVFAELEKEKNELSRESADLTKTAQQLNTLINEVNELGDRGNQLVEAYNKEVAAYNEHFGFAREFTQGDYHAGQINVYKFSDERELVSVLAHEFGHALGVGHVDGNSSVMYYLLEDTSSVPVLTTEDKTAFLTLCGEGDEWPHTVRRTIRTFLQKF